MTDPTSARWQLHVERPTRLWFGPGDPVRAASGVARLGDGWLVAQDDANHAAWWRPAADEVNRVRLFPPRDGRDLFDEASGTKHLKPDLEASCQVSVDGRPAVLLLGSGSLPARMRAALVIEGVDGLEVRTADLTPLYELVREALGLAEQQLNLEGACVVGGRLHWFQRGHGGMQVTSASVELEAAAVAAAVLGEREPAAIDVGGVRRYQLGTVAGLELAVTDVVALPDGRLCLSATAEDAPDAIADGPVVGSALGLVDGDEHQMVGMPVEMGDGKVEGLALVDAQPDRIRLLAVVDQDDRDVASLAMHLTLERPTAPG